MNFNLAELEAADVDEDAFPILLDLEGNLTEGTINSVFMVTDGVLRTAEDSTVLQSVSRGTVFELAKQLGIPVAEEVLQPYDLYTADESFVAFTGPGVLPMTRVDNRDVGDGKPGRSRSSCWRPGARRSVSTSSTRRPASPRTDLGGR